MNLGREEFQLARLLMVVKVTPLFSPGSGRISS
jgi:hypothetical protein